MKDNYFEKNFWKKSHSNVNNIVHFTIKIGVLQSMLYDFARDDFHNSAWHVQIKYV